MILAEQFIALLNYEKKQLYKNFIENLEDLVNKKHQLKKFIHSFDNIVTGIEEEKLNEQTSASLKKNLVENLKNLDISPKHRKTLRKEIRLNIDFLKDLHQFSNDSKIIIPVLKGYQGLDFIKCLDRIHLFYNSNEKVLEILYKFRHLVQKLFEMDVSRTLETRNLRLLNKNIDRYNNYIDMTISEDYNLVEIFEDCLDRLDKQRGKNYHYRLQQIEEYKKEHKDWIENEPIKVLEMYSPLISRRRRTIPAERKTLVSVLNHYKKNLER